METTPSTVRKTSQASSASYKSKQEGTKMDRSALLDITNDSPITGLANGSFTKSPVKDLTPGSGEALLRGQVKNLLQKVEEGNKMPSFSRNLIPHSKLGFARSPMQLLAPTPANTPQFPPFADHGFLQPPPLIVSPVVPHSESLGPCMTNRALVFDDSSDDSPDKQDASSGRISSLTCLEELDTSSESESNSSVTYQESIGSVGFKLSRFASPVSDNSSEWSIKANAGTEEEESEGSNGGFGCLDAICEGMKKMKVGFEGKHVRFLYNSDGEIEGEEVDCIENCAKVVGPGDAMLLKGLPVPEGKHLKFQEEEEEEIDLGKV